MTPKKLGRYEVLRVIGKGAMGVVYEGRDPNLDRRVAIKTVKVENLSEEAAAEYEHRFRTEARSAARLQHPNIVSVYDSDRDGGVAFLVMEYIDGDDLKHHLDRGVRYSLEQSLKIVRDLLAALDYAHRQGIVHRDIKPANLLIEPAGRVKLADFGVARIQDAGESTRTQGSMVGTLKYMAPEQVQGQKIDARADLFSAGVVLYQLITDKRPFDGENDFSVIHQIIGQEPPPPSSINPKLPPALDAVVARALAKDREQRFASARDFAVALQAAIRRAEDPTVVPPPNPKRMVEMAPTRPLTTPGTSPGTVPGGTSPTVTQELELVYWKDVKDSTDPEDVEGFLERFPNGIYAELARRRLRRLAAGGEPSVPAGLLPAGLLPAAAATRTQTESQNSVFPNSVFPNDASVLASGPAPLAAAPKSAPDLRPGSWIAEEYTRTVPQPKPARADEGSTLPTTAAKPGSAAAATAPTDGSAPTVATAPRAGSAPPASRAAAADAVYDAAHAKVAPGPEREPAGDDTDAAPRPKKRVGQLAVAGLLAVTVAGVLALALGRGPRSTPEAAAPAASSTHATAAGTAKTPSAPVVVRVPTETAVVAPPVTGMPPPPAGATAQRPDKAAQKRAAASQPRTAMAAPQAGEEPPGMPAPVLRPEPVPPPRPTAPVVAGASAANYQAVEQCRDRVFFVRELCLAEHCDKAGARNHPLCVKRRDDARLREESRESPAR